MKNGHLKKYAFRLAAVAAFALVMGAGIQSAMAYFTTYVTAEGGYEITLGSQTTVEEEVEDMTKHIVVSNTGENECYVRVKVFSGSRIEIVFSGDERWVYEEEDGYYYYEEIVPVGGSTEKLLASIEIPEDYTDEFNVIVVQECTAVLYTEEGTPYADWENVADTQTHIGTAQGEESDGE